VPLAAASPDASWSFEPAVLALTFAAGYVYLRRFRAVRAEQGTLALPGWRAASFLAGLACVLIALVSPVDRLGEQIMTMHMVQHLLLLDLAPVLCLLGLTRVLMRPVTRHTLRLERSLGPFGHPAFAALFYVGVMWAWHVPALYDGSLRDSTVHVAEHLFFAIAGGLYWWHLLGPIRSRHRLSGLAPLAYMIGTKIAVGLLGIGLTFSPNALYAFYENQPRYWGLTPGDDQAVAGLIMALEQSIVMGIVLTWLFVRLLSEADADDLRRERYARTGQPG
jgi:cytochrome c oxidase assembly factor CtaG